MEGFRFGSWFCEREEGKVNHLSAVYRLQKKGAVQHWLFFPGLLLWEQLLGLFLILDIDSVEKLRGTYSERKEQSPACGAVYRLQGEGESQCCLFFSKICMEEVAGCLKP